MNINVETKFRKGTHHSQSVYMEGGADRVVRRMDSWYPYIPVSFEVFHTEEALTYCLCYNCIIVCAQKIEGKGVFPQMSTWFAPSAASGPYSNVSF